MNRWDPLTPRSHGQNSPASTRPLSSGVDSRSATLSRIERFLVGEIGVDELSLLEFALWLDGRLAFQRRIDDLEEELRLRDIIDARRAPLDVKPMLGPTFAELSIRRHEPPRAERAEQASRRRRGDAA